MKKIQLLEEDLELRLKVDIHELEERKNLHINNLLKAFEEKMDNWKKENSPRMCSKNYVNDLISKENKTLKLSFNIDFIVVYTG